MCVYYVCVCVICVSSFFFFFLLLFPLFSESNYLSHTHSYTYTFYNTLALHWVWHRDCDLLKEKEYTWYEGGERRWKGAKKKKKCWDRLKGELNWSLECWRKRVKKGKWEMMTLLLMKTTKIRFTRKNNFNKISLTLVLTINMKKQIPKRTWI